MGTVKVHQLHIVAVVPGIDQPPLRCLIDKELEMLNFHGIEGKRIKTHKKTTNATSRNSDGRYRIAKRIFAEAPIFKLLGRPTTDIKLLTFDDTL